MDDTRRQNLAAAIVRATVESEGFDLNTFKRWFDKGLTRKDDRELLGPPDELRRLNGRTIPPGSTCA